MAHAHKYLPTTSYPWQSSARTIDACLSPKSCVCVSAQLQGCALACGAWPLLDARIVLLLGMERGFFNNLTGVSHHECPQQPLQDEHWAASTYMLLL